MAIYQSNKKVVAVYKGSTTINKIYKGVTLVFQKGGGSQSVPVVITFTDNSDPAKRQYKPLCEGTTKTATSQTIELPSEGETYEFVNTNTLLEVRNYSNNCPSVTSLSNLFYPASNMKTLTFAKGIDTSKIKSMNYMFAYCSSLVSLDVSSFDTSNCTYFDNMFRDCRSLHSLDLSSFNISKCKNFYGIFYNCHSLVSLDLSSFDMSEAISYDNMFGYCDKLTHIKCKQAFKDWCITNQDTIKLPDAMREGGSGTWEIIG